MKRKEFIRELTRKGCILLRPGSRHDIYINQELTRNSRFPAILKLTIISFAIFANILAFRNTIYFS